MASLLKKISYENQGEKQIENRELEENRINIETMKLE